MSCQDQLFTPQEALELPLTELLYTNIGRSYLESLKRKLDFLGFFFKGVLDLTQEGSSVLEQQVESSRYKPLVGIVSHWEEGGGRGRHLGKCLPMKNLKKSSSQALKTAMT